MTIDTELSRIGISLPRHLPDRFDEIINYCGNSSRSEGIRDTIRSYIRTGSGWWMLKGNGRE